MSSTKYEVKGTTYGYYVYRKLNKVSYPITPLHNCGCGKSYYIQEKNNNIFVVKYSCSCGGYYVMRINEEYFDE
jgi:hypothetical protein